MSPSNLFILLVLSIISTSMVIEYFRQRKTTTNQEFDVPEINLAVLKSKELNRPVVFIPGSRDIDNIQTVSALLLLKVVAKYCAEIGVELVVPVCRSLVLEKAQSICQEAYTEAGCKEDWCDSNVAYVTDDPLGFVAHIDGMISRINPGACFMFGFFAGESLLIAESAFSVAEVRIAGTAIPSQLPFFVASCDKTLIGEEFLSSSALLKGESADIAMLKGLDVGKVLAFSIIIISFLIFLYTALFLEHNYDSLYAFYSSIFKWGM